VSLAPKTQFARRGDADLAYQVYGDGPTNVLFIHGVPEHLELQWQFPLAVRANERLARLARVAQYDWRGYGMSDPLPPSGYSIEELAADALAVLDAAGFADAVAWGDTVGGAVAVWLAVHYPTRVNGLVLVDAYACVPARPGYDLGWTEAAIAERRELFRSVWGTGAGIALLAPSLAGDDRLRDEWARYERVSATPNSFLAHYDLSLTLDVRGLLGEIAVPTLVVHSATNPVIPIVFGRYLAANIAGARFVEVTSDSPLEWTTGGIAGEVAEFLTGSRAGAHVERSLQVVLFADIAESTVRAAAMGDDAWRDLLGDFRRVVRRALDRYGAREVNTRGDDFFAVVASPSVAIEIAREIRSQAAVLDLEVRTGLHLGEVEQQGDDFAGLAVHIGARIAALAKPGEILVSQTVRDALIGSETDLTKRGTEVLKGVPGEWQIFAVHGASGVS
jgi:pimeloyl-ACP methyl ester carboxylesterase